jgi:hypothetical protein
MTRICNDCKVEKTDIHFQYGKRSRGYCRDCNNLKRKELYKRGKEKANSISKICTSCNVEKCGDNFFYASNICKQCLSEKESDKNHKPSTDDPPKICSKCSVEQPATEYRYHSNICKSCNKDKLYKWREKNSDKFKSICKTYREKDESKEKRSAYARKRYAEDENHRILTNYRNRVRTFVKNGSKYGKEDYEKLLGCSHETFKKWIESNMLAGMNWENYGSLWHIDHTIPCSLFDLTIHENITKCFHWTNTSPMIGDENLTKSDKLDMVLINRMEDKARQFIVTNKNLLVTESLPEKLRA